MNFVSPQVSEDFNRRDLLLVEALRPDPLPFSIREEYPIVLDRHHNEFSHILEEDGMIVAHANLWPRVIRDRDQNISIPIGLIGNVATSLKKRSQGYMRKLMDHLQQKSAKIGLNALILWSDLLPFYQNLGFSSLGREYRVFFRKGDLSHIVCEHTALVEVDPENLRKKDLEALIGQRYPVTYTLERSTSEFATLLHIPALRIFVGRGKHIERYFLMGKGYDMVGVIHEWGAATPLALVDGVKNIMAITGLEEIVVLCPGGIASKWVEDLSRYAVKCEAHPMALCHQIKQGANLAAILRDLFIWGTDSI